MQNGTGTVFRQENGHFDKVRSEEFFRLESEEWRVESGDFIVDS
jgi:hypothetical protein